MFDWPRNGRLFLPGLKTPVAKAYLLAAPSGSVKVKSGNKGTTIKAGKKAPDPISSTVVLELKGDLK